MTFDVKVNLNAGPGGPGGGHGLHHRNPGQQANEGFDGGRGHGNGLALGRGDGPGNAAGSGAGFGLGVGRGLGAQVGVGLGVEGLAPGTLNLRPNDEPMDADAVARLRRQAEGVDLQSARDVRSSTAPARSAEAPGQAGPAAATGLQARGDAETHAGARAGRNGAPAGSGAAVGSGAGTGVGTAVGFGLGADPRAPGRGPATAGTAALDRLVTALVDPAKAAPAQRGPTPDGRANAAVLGASAVPEASAPRKRMAAPPAAADSAPAMATVRSEPTRPAGAMSAPGRAGASPGTAAAAALSSPVATGTPTQPPASALTRATPEAPAMVRDPAQLPPASAVQATDAPKAADRSATQVAVGGPPVAGPQPAITPQQPGAQQQAVSSQAPDAARQIAAPAAGQTAAPGMAITAASPPAALDCGPQASYAAALAGEMAPSTRGASVDAHFVSPVAAVGPQIGGQPQLARQTIARQVVAVEAVERAAGSAAAIRELGARVRDLPSDATAQVLSAVQPTLGRAAESYAATPRIERVNGILERSAQEVSSQASMVRAGADLAAALDAGALQGASSHVTQDVARAIANGERLTAERAIAFGAAAAFGSGLALPIALIEAFDERRDGETARALETALAAGLARLLRRVAEAVEALSRVAGPLAFEWAAWRASGLSGAEIERRLRARLAGREGLVREIDDALEAVEIAGADMVRALERLSRWTSRTAEIVAVWREATASRKIAFAIAQSLAAQHVVAQALAAGLRTEPPGAPDDFTIVAARRLYETFGFAPGAAAELAEVTAARHAAVQMSGGWMRARRPPDPSSEAAFARIVAFLNGQCAPSNRHVETVTFADLDPEGERPVTLVGGPLLERFELMDAA